MLDIRTFVCFAFLLIFGMRFVIRMENKPVKNYYRIFLVFLFLVFCYSNSWIISIVFEWTFQSCTFVAPLYSFALSYNRSYHFYNKFVCIARALICKTIGTHYGLFFFSLSFFCFVHAKYLFYKSAWIRLRLCQWKYPINYNYCSNRLCDSLSGFFLWIILVRCVCLCVCVSINWTANQWNCYNKVYPIPIDLANNTTNNCLFSLMLLEPCRDVMWFSGDEKKNKRSTILLLNHPPYVDERITHRYNLNKWKHKTNWQPKATEKKKNTQLLIQPLFHFVNLFWGFTVCRFLVI